MPLTGAPAIKPKNPKIAAGATPPSTPQVARRQVGMSRSCRPVSARAASQAVVVPAIPPAIAYINAKRIAAASTASPVAFEPNNAPITPPTTAQVPAKKPAIFKSALNCRENVVGPPSRKGT